jgi:hypothetical protein
MALVRLLQYPHFVIGIIVRPADIDDIELPSLGRVIEKYISKDHVYELSGGSWFEATEYKTGFSYSVAFFISKVCITIAPDAGPSIACHEKAARP